MAENVQDSRLNRAVQETSKYNHRKKKKSYCKNHKHYFQLKRQQQVLMTRQKGETNNLDFYLKAVETK